jgi:hypothetical protein
MLQIAHNPPPLLLQRRQRFAVVRQPFSCVAAFALCVTVWRQVNQPWKAKVAAGARVHVLRCG